MKVIKCICFGEGIHAPISFLWHRCKWLQLLECVLKVNI